VNFELVSYVIRHICNVFILLIKLLGPLKYVLGGSPTATVYLDVRCTLVHVLLHVSFSLPNIRHVCLPHSIIIYVHTSYFHLSREISATIFNAVDTSFSRYTFMIICRSIHTRSHYSISEYYTKHKYEHSKITNCNGEPTLNPNFQKHSTKFNLK